MPMITANLEGERLFSWSLSPDMIAKAVETYRMMAAEMHRSPEQFAQSVFSDLVRTGLDAEPWVRARRNWLRSSALSSRKISRIRPTREGFATTQRYGISRSTLPAKATDFVSTFTVAGSPTHSANQHHRECRTEIQAAAAAVVSAACRVQRLATV